MLDVDISRTMATSRTRTSFTYPSKREIEVLKLIANELTITEIASALFISVETVKTHRRHLLKKMKVRNTAGLVRKSFELRILLIETSVLQVT